MNIGLECNGFECVAMNIQKEYEGYVSGYDYR